MKILLQALLLAGYGAGGVLAWRTLRPATRALLHRCLPALALAHAALMGVLAADGAGAALDLSGAAVGFALVLLCVAWAQNAAWGVHGTYRFVLPLCAAAVLVPAVLEPGPRDAAGPGAAYWVHLFFAAMAYAFVVLAFIQMLVRGIEERRMPGDVTDDSLAPLLTIERLALRNTRVGLALLTLALASGAYFAVSGGDAVGLTHKNLFAALTWVTLAAYVAGHRAWGWRGRTARNYMGAGFAFLALSYFGTAFVLEVVLAR